MASVSIVGISDVRNQYTVAAGVRKAIALAGGLGELVHPGMVVIVKPNMVGKPPSPTSGVCTSVLVCKAVADVVRELRATPVVADSASWIGDTEAAFQVMGYDDLRLQGYDVVDLKKTATTRVTVERGKIVREATTFELVTRADAIISVPVMKTHDQAHATLALKNMLGLVTDVEKRRIHREGLYEGIVDLVGHFKPVFAVIDGLIGHEGLGPSGGFPIEMGVVIAGRDLVAVDSVAGRVMGFEPDELPITSLAAERGLGTMDDTHIDLAGDSLETVRRRFIRAEEDSRIDTSGITMVQDDGTCTGCRNCFLSCLVTMKAEGTIERVRGIKIVTGPALLPQAVSGDRLVAVGTCGSSVAGPLGLCVAGCPPNKKDVIRAIIEWVEGG